MRCQWHVLGLLHARSIMPPADSSRQNRLDFPVEIGKDLHVDRRKWSQATNSRKNTPSGIQTGDETAWVVFLAQKQFSPQAQKDSHRLQCILSVTKSRPNYAWSSPHAVQSPGFTISMHNACPFHSIFSISVSVSISPGFTLPMLRC